MMALHWRLIYTSRRTCRAADAEAEVRAIQTISSSNNQRAQLQGALVASQSRFAQILEGPRDALECRFEIICCDHRHTDLLVMSFAPIDRPAFDDFQLRTLAFDDSSLTEGETPGEVMVAQLRASISRLDTIFQSA